jgi:hypothetical protein
MLETLELVGILMCDPYEAIAINIDQVYMS